MQTTRGRVRVIHRGRSLIEAAHIRARFGWAVWPVIVAIWCD